MRGRSVWTTIVGAAFILGTTVACHAEFSLPLAFGWHRGVPLGLIESEAVQKDLNLTADTIEKLSKLRDQIETEAQEELLKTWQGGKFKTLSDLSPQDRKSVCAWMKYNRRVIQSIQKNHQPQLNELLTPAQQIRLDEIDLQAAAGAALVDPDFAQELAVTESQKQSIVGIYFERHKQITKPSKSSSRTRKSIDEQLMDVLNPSQKETFEKLKGKPLLPADEVKAQRFQRLRTYIGVSSFKSLPVR